VESLFEIIECLGDELPTVLAVQAISTLFQLQKFVSNVVDYVDEGDNLEMKAEFNRMIKADDRFKKLVEKVKE